jgi:3-hydroxyacyl-[acyl-carrier-protein] dehydratase
VPLLSAIPHRPPFLFVDEIVSVEEHIIRTRRRVPEDDPVFAGHFPGRPVLPGVLVCEALFQSGALLIAHLEPGGLAGKVPVLTRIAEGKFKQMVRPGDVLEMDVTLREKLGGAYFLRGVARVGGKVAVSVEFACAAVAEGNPA